MKFAATAGGFISAISFAAEVSQNAAVKDHADLNKITIKADKDQITVLAFNGRVGIESNLSNLTTNDLGYKFEEEGLCTVNSKDFLNIMTSFNIKESLHFETKAGLDNTNELVVSKESDKEEFQTLPVYPQNDAVNLPAKSTNFANEITIRKDIFSESLKKIRFAFGFENKDSKVRYLYWVLRLSKNKVRFVSGTGSLFACLDVEGKNIIKSGGKTSLLFPTRPVDLLLKILAATAEEDVMIKESDPKDTSVPYQIVIKTNIADIILVGLDASISWIDEDAQMGLDFTHKFVTKIEDWEYTAKGIEATFNDAFKQTQRCHRASVEVKPKDSVIVVKADDFMKASRKVPVQSLDFPKDAGDATFICPSVYLSEIKKQVKDGYVQFEFIGGSTRPVLVNCYGKPTIEKREHLKKDDDILKISETLTIFFATLK
jgi:hypothetical protein